MIINSALTSSLAIAADKAVAEIGDDNTQVPSTINPVEKLLSPHHVLVGGVPRTASSSFISFFENLRAASTAATNTVVVTLTRGLWTITWHMHVDFQSGGTANQQSAVRFGVQMESDTQYICGIFRSSAPQTANGKFRLLLGADANLRLDIVATGVSDAIDAFLGLNCEKNIG